MNTSHPEAHTFWLGVPRSIGYLCAIERYGLTFPDSEAPLHKILEWASTLASLYATGESDIHTFGYWLDNGVWYVDTCTWYAKRAKAIEAGLRENQIAIWDIARQESVYILHPAVPYIA